MQLAFSTEKGALKFFLIQACLCLFIFFFSNYYSGLHRPDIAQISSYPTLAERCLGGFYFFF